VISGSLALKNVFNTLQISPELLVIHCVALSADTRRSRESSPGDEELWL